MTDLSTYLAENYSKATAKAYLREIAIFMASMSAPMSATYAQIMAYMGILRTKYKNAKTLNRILSSIKAYFDYLVESGLRADNPAKSIILKDKVVRAIQLQDLLSTAQLYELLSGQKERYNALKVRNEVLMSLLIHQALRPKELANLQISDVDLAQATVFIAATNTTNSRYLPLKAAQILLFQTYQEKIRPALLAKKQAENSVETPLNAYLLSLRGNAFSEDDLSGYFKHHYPKSVSATIIRQSVITNLLKNNDLRIVQVFAGHKYPSTTEAYKQDDVTQLQSEIMRFHPMK